MGKWLAGVAGSIMASVIASLIVFHLTTDRQSNLSSSSPTIESIPDGTLRPTVDPEPDVELKIEADSVPNEESEIESASERASLTLINDYVIRGTNFGIYDTENVYNLSSDNLVGRKEPPNARICLFDLTISGERLCVVQNGQVLTVDPMAGAVPVGICKPV